MCKHSVSVLLQKQISSIIYLLFAPWSSDSVIPKLHVQISSPPETLLDFYFFIFPEQLCWNSARNMCQANPLYIPKQGKIVGSQIPVI